MKIGSGTLALARRLCAQLEPPEISGLHLPELSPDDEFRDEFGFVFLEDGTAAPFYVSLPGTLAELHDRFPDPGGARLSLSACLEALADAALPDRALAIGAWNALSQHLLRRAEFEWPPRAAEDASRLVAGETVGMVGYFCPVVDRLVEKGVRVLVVEQQPERVPRRDNVELSTELAVLADCRLVYCTASTLINNTLEQVIASCIRAEAVDLIGPTGSGLPDVLFDRGVRAVGGVTFANAAALREVLARRESWGSVGSKYELTAANYPGVETLLETALARPAWAPVTPAR